MHGGYRVCDIGLPLEIKTLIPRVRRVGDDGGGVSMNETRQACSLHDREPFISRNELNELDQRSATTTTPRLHTITPTRLSRSASKASWHSFTISALLPRHISMEEEFRKEPMEKMRHRDISVYGQLNNYDRTILG